MILKKRRTFQTEISPNEWIARQKEAFRRIEGAFDPSGFDPPDDQPCAPEEILYRLVASGSCTDDFERETDPFDGWGAGGLGTWVQGAGAFYVVSGTGIDANPTTFNSYVEYPLGDGEIELLFQVEMRSTVNVPWNFDIGVADSSFPSGDSVSFSMLGFGASSTLIHVTDDRPGSNLDDDDVTLGVMRNKILNIRLLIDERGTFARVWEDGDTEPVLTAGLTAPIGDRSEQWHAYAVSQDSERTPIGLDRIFTVAGTGDTYKIYNLEVITPCTGSGDGFTIINDQSDEVGTVDSDGVIDAIELNMECPLYFVQDAVLLSGSTYEIATDALYIMDVWFDYLHATPEVHWLYESPRYIEVLSPIIDGTLVRVSYVTDSEASI